MDEDQLICQAATAARPCLATNAETLQPEQQPVEVAQKGFALTGARLCEHHGPLHSTRGDLCFIREPRPFRGRPLWQRGPSDPVVKNSTSTTRAREQVALVAQHDSGVLRPSSDFKRICSLLDYMHGCGARQRWTSRTY